MGTHGHDPLNFNNFRRIISWRWWRACSGSRADSRRDDAGDPVGVALGIECVGPYAGFHVPGLGRSGTSDWRVDGAHMAERSALFVIIALGESILVTGATAAAQPATAAHVGAFLVAFLGSVAMWWIYFNIGAERGSHQFAQLGGSGTSRARRVHLFPYPYRGRIVVCAVADEITIKHPVGHMELSAAATLLGGPALYLAGNILFKRASAQYYPLSHLVGLGLLLLLTRRWPCSSRHSRSARLPPWCWSWWLSGRRARSRAMRGELPPA